MAAENAQFERELRLDVNVKNYVFDSLFNGIDRKPFLAPFKLTIDPRDLYAFENKIKKIEYNWGDGESEDVDFKVFANNDSNLSLPFPLEVGNPLNFKKDHTFQSKELQPFEYDVTVRVYFFNSPTIENFNIKIILSNPDLENTINGYFDEIHLIKTRMFGPKNKNIFTFQTHKGDKKYITMASINWNKATVPLNITENLSRTYALVSPLQYKFSSLTALNQKIKYIPYRKVETANNDFGGFDS